MCDSIPTSVIDPLEIKECEDIWCRKTSGITTRMVFLTSCRVSRKSKECLEESEKIDEGKWKPLPLRLGKTQLWWIGYGVAVPNKSRGSESRRCRRVASRISMGFDFVILELDAKVILFITNQNQLLSPIIAECMMLSRRFWLHIYHEANGPFR